MPSDKVVSIEVTNDLIEHMKVMDLLNLAQTIARDMSLRYQVEDMHQAVTLVEELAGKLNASYEMIKNGEVDVNSNTLNLPDIDTLSDVERGELKSKLNKTISELDKKASLGSK